MSIARRVVRAEAWNVVHPLSGDVEASEANRDLALAVAAEFDRSDPVDCAWIFERLYEVSGRDRGSAEWVMPTAVANVLRKVKDHAGQYLWASLAGTPDFLIGKPVRIDDDARGLRLQVSP
jgi:predicted phage gp36 major capsid-like protein